MQSLKSQKPYTLAGFDPEIFCSVGGDDNQNVHLAARAKWLNPTYVFFRLG
jgi:hypothetical protein